jgi:hypothetical protein
MPIFAANLAASLGQIESFHLCSFPRNCCIHRVAVDDLHLAVAQLPVSQCVDNTCCNAVCLLFRWPQWLHQLLENIGVIGSCSAPFTWYCIVLPQPANHPFYRMHMNHRAPELLRIGNHIAGATKACGWFAIPGSNQQIARLNQPMP